MRKVLRIRHADPNQPDANIVTRTSLTVRNTQSAKAVLGVAAIPKCRLNLRGPLEPTDEEIATSLSDFFARAVRYFAEHRRVARLIFGARLSSDRVDGAGKNPLKHLPHANADGQICRCFRWLPSLW